MVPNGWEVKKLGELCSLNPKKPSKPDDGVVSFIAMPQLSESGKVISTKKKPYDEVSKGFTSFVNKDVLVAKITPCFENGKGALVDNLENGIGFGSTEFHVLRAKKGTHPEFIYYLTRTKELRVKGEMNMQGSAGHRRVTADYFNAYKVVTPPYSEQRKIAKILSTWDKAISTTEKLIETSKQQKKALMQQLLTGKKRLVDPETGKAFEGEWEEVKVSTLITKHSEKTETNKQYPVLTSSRKGIYFQSDYYNDRDVASEDTTGYNVVPRGYFTYRHMSDDLVFKFNRNTICDKGIVSTLYPVFAANEEAVVPYLLQAILNEGSAFKRFSLSQKQGGSRTYMYLSKLNELKIQIPSLTEQQKITSVLTAADKEIEVLEAKLAHCKQEKKALMQQLLTGKRRVKVDEMEVA